MLLLDVGIAPVDTDERKYTFERILRDVLFQVDLALEGLESDFAKADAELGALSAGEVGKRQHEAETLYGECLDAVLDDDPLSHNVNVLAEEYATAVKTDGMNINESVAASEVRLEAIAITTSDEDGPIWSFFLQLVPSNFLEKTGLDECLSQDKVVMIFYHYL